jgi:hypothetical protein
MLPTTRRSVGDRDSVSGPLGCSPERQRTLKKLVELRLNILSASLMRALRRVAVPAPPAVVVVAAPLM